MEEAGLREHEEVLTCSGSATDILRSSFKLYPIKEVKMLTRYMAQEAQNPHTFNKGTTTLGFVFDHGVILAVDSRASMGPIVSTQNVSKVIEINSYLLGTMAGGAADCSYWERHLAKLCRLHELRNQSRISVAAASQILANIFYYFKGYGLSAGTMIAGYDINGPGLYYVSSEGERMRGRLFSVGSGSMFAYGVIDQEYRSNMTLEEAVELGSRAIYQAAHRDGYSGGFVNLYHVHKDGWTKLVDRRDVNEIHYLYAEKKGFLSHCYVFFKEWHVAKHTLLANLRQHLRLVNRLKCALFDPDARNLERDEFLDEMPVAYQRLSDSLVLPFTQ